MVNKLQITGGRCAVCDQICHMVCSGCGKRYYCTKAHQLKDYPEHGGECEKRKGAFEEYTDLPMPSVLIETKMKEAGIILKTVSPGLMGKDLEDGVLHVAVFLAVQEVSPKLRSIVRNEGEKSKNIGTLAGIELKDMLRRLVQLPDGIPAAGRQIETASTKRERATEGATEGEDGPNKKTSTFQARKDAAIRSLSMGVREILDQDVITPESAASVMNNDSLEAIQISNEINLLDAAISAVEDGLAAFTHAQSGGVGLLGELCEVVQRVPFRARRKLLRDWKVYEIMIDFERYSGLVLEFRKVKYVNRERFVTAMGDMKAALHEGNKMVAEAGIWLRKMVDVIKGIDRLDTSFYIYNIPDGSVATCIKQTRKAIRTAERVARSHGRSEDSVWNTFVKFLCVRRDCSIIGMVHAMQKISTLVLWAMTGVITVNNNYTPFGGKTLLADYTKYARAYLGWDDINVDHVMIENRIDPRGTAASVIRASDDVARFAREGAAGASDLAVRGAKSGYVATADAVSSVKSFFSTFSRFGTNATELATNATGLATNATELTANATGVAANATDLARNATTPLSVPWSLRPQWAWFRILRNWPSAIVSGSDAGVHVYETLFSLENLCIAIVSGITSQDSLMWIIGGVVVAYLKTLNIAPITIGMVTSVTGSPLDHAKVWDVRKRSKKVSAEMVIAGRELRRAMSRQRVELSMSEDDREDAQDDRLPKKYR